MSEGGITLIDEITGRLAIYSAGVEIKAHRAMEQGAQEILAYGKQNAPWSDQTGAARAGLETEVSDGLGEIYIDFAHTVEHGVWLEVIQSGRFAIIMPTLELFAARIFEQAGAGILGGDGE